ncbi:MFS transporter [Advenella incenata]
MTNTITNNQSNPIRKKQDSRAGWMVLILTLTIQALATMVLLVPPVMAPVLSDQLGVPAGYIGFYIAVAYLSAMLSSLSAGAMLTMVGPIRLSALCLVSSAAGLTLFVMAPSVWTLALAGVFIGLGYGPVTPCSSQILIKNTPMHRLSLIFSIKQTGVPLGGVLAAMIMPSLEQMVGWHSALGVVCVVLFFCAVVSLFAPRSWEPDATGVRRSFREEFFGALGTIYRVPVLRTLAVCSFCFSVCQLTLMTYAITFLHNEVGMSLVLAGVFLSVSQAAGVIGRILWGYLADNFFSTWSMLLVLAAGMLLSAVGVFYIDADSSQWWIIFVFAVFGATAIGWNGVYLAEVARRAPEGKSGSVTGATLAVTYLGVVLGPPAIGLVSQATGGFGYGFLSLLLPTIASIILLGRTKRHFQGDK